MEEKFTCNLHTHTVLCNHADGTMRDFVEAAVAAGFDTLGFSDHAPTLFDDDFHSWFRMSFDEQKGYVDEALALREEFGGKIDIPIGYELEYYPRHFRETLSLITRYPCDYLILGQHFTFNEQDGEYAGDHLGIEGLKQYVYQVCEAMSLGIYTYFAHPDLINFSGDTDTYLRETEEICRVSLETDTPLEINMLGIRGERDYPKDYFWEMVGRHGCKVVAGSDAHETAPLENETGYAKVREMVEKYSLNYVARPRLKKVILP